VGNFSEINLVRILLALKKKLWLLLLLSLLAGSAFFVYTRYAVTPLYRASVSLFVDNSGEGGTQTLADINAARQLVNTYIAMASSNTVLNQVAEEIDNAYSAGDIRAMITTSIITNTEIFRIEITNASPGKAALIANVIADVATVELPNFIEGSSIRVVDSAQAPRTPFSPSVPRNTVLGTMFGFLLAAGIVILLDIRSDKVETVEKTDMLFGVPILGEIPSFKNHQ